MELENLRQDITILRIILIVFLQHQHFVYSIQVIPLKCIFSFVVMNDN